MRLLSKRHPIMLVQYRLVEAFADSVRLRVRSAIEAGVRVVLEDE